MRAEEEEGNEMKEGGREDKNLKDWKRKKRPNRRRCANSVLGGDIFFMWKGSFHYSVLRHI